MLPFFFASGTLTFAQDCPPNIDFEKGNFDGWTCYAGNTYTSANNNIINLLPTGPQPDQHTLYGPESAGLVDEFGGFPVICPNGSGYSVKLGNTSGGAQAEGISYSFTIPSGRNYYSVVYHYAVVFQDPNHLHFQQPRLVLEVWNETDDVLIQCSSFTFYPVGSGLPGFFNAGIYDSAAVWCKNWTAVTINLNNMAGKLIKLFFKTADCTFRRHFGYAYIDVNTECSSEFTGATFCPDDTAVVVTGPHGYARYRWFNSNFSTLLGNSQTLTLQPPPPRGTVLALEVMPYDGYGCPDTLFALLYDTLTLRANAGPDVLSCNRNPVMIGSNRKEGVVYNWNPPEGLSDPNSSNPRASPSSTTAYILTVRSRGGGCMNRDTVVVTASVIDSSLQVSGKSLFCITSGDSAVLSVNPTDSIQWYINNTPIRGATQPRFRATQTGNYYAQLFTFVGCSAGTRRERIIVEVPKPGIQYPVQYAIKSFPLPLQARNFGEQYVWSPSVFLSNPRIINPVFTSPVEGDQIYRIKIITPAGCETIDTQLVITLKDVQIHVPNAFTPNNDGKNDFFRPHIQGIKQMIRFSVFNRWGQLLYDSQSPEARWDGTWNGAPQNPGIYTWIFEAIGLDNRRHFRKGTVMLIR
ncbi:MAG: gliding motility-associated C-terminal domain-containing protein [Chitinophagaceae bacterium]|nr:gliding motility-associated C-terminal domain-containing protein [Chitinophagaceae bacterium]